MSENISKRVILAGLPETGKSTFVSALWYYLTNCGDRSLLKVRTLNGSEDSYLNEICGKWLDCEELSRTSLVAQGGEKISMQLLRVDTAENIQLDIPDFKGEVFNQQFANREWTEEFLNLLDECCGIVMFVSPLDPANIPSLLYTENEVLRGMGGAPDPEPGLPIPFDKKKIPNQVKNVDILQFVQTYSSRDVARKLALVVSAWDKVLSTQGEQLSPRGWCEKSMPLLYQYLNSNSSSFDVRYFGVSAQGGDYGDPAQRSTLLEMEDAMEKMFLVDENGRSNEIAKPLLWITV